MPFFTSVMERTLDEIERLSSTQLIVQPETTIFRTLTMFREYFDPDAGIEMLQKYEKSLFSLINVNKGNYSIQCAVYVGQFLSNIFNLLSKSIDNVLLNLVSYQTPASIIIVGEICIGVHAINAMNLSLVVNNLLKFNDLLHLEVAYTMRCIVRSAHKKGLKIDLPSIFDHFKLILTKTSWQSTDESIRYQILLIKLFRSFVKYDPNFLQRDSAQAFFNLIHEKFHGNAKVEAIRYISLYASLIPVPEGLRLLENIHISRKFLLRFYLMNLEADVLVANIDLITNYVCENMPSQLYIVSKFLPKSKKEDTFGKILSQKTPSIQQVLQLQGLDVDELTSASLALQLIKNNKKVDLDFLGTFFKGLTAETQAIFIKSSISSLHFKYDKANSFVVETLAPLKQAPKEMEDLATHMVSVKQFQLPLLWILLANIENDNIAKNVHIDAALDTITSSRDTELHSAVMSYFLSHPEHSQVETLVRYSLAHLESMSISSLKALVVLSPRYVKNDNFVSFLTTKVLTNELHESYCLKQISYSKIFDIDETFQPIDDNRSEFMDFIKLIIDQYYTIFMTASEAVQVKIIRKLSITCTSSALSLILSLVKQPDLIHPKIIEVLLSNTNLFYENRVIKCMLTCEVIALFPMKIEQMFALIEQNPSFSCLFIASFASNVHLPTNYLSRALIYIDQHFMDKDMYALFSFLALLDTHPMEYTTLNLGAHHLDLLLQLLHHPHSPVVYKYISLIVESLLPLMSPELVDPLSPVSVLCISILSTLYSLHNVEAKYSYYRTMSSICEFSPSLVQYIDFQFPKSNTTVIFNACQAISQYLAIREIPEVIEMLPKLFLILQMMPKPSVIHAIEAIALNVRVTGELKLRYCAYLNSVFRTNGYLPGFATILASRDVQKVCLSFIAPLLKTEIDSSTIKEILNALSKGLELGLHKEVYALFHKVLEIKETEYLLEYEEQFAQLVNYSFKQDLDLSGQFLLATLNVFGEKMVDLFSDNLLISEQTNSSFYFHLATSLCLICSKKNLELKNIDFLTKAKKLFGEIITKGMTSSPTVPQFTSFTYDFYNELFVAYIWIESKTEINIEHSVFIGFFLLEIAKSNEFWRVRAAIDGMTALAKFFYKDIGLDNLVTFLNLATNLNEKMLEMVSKSLSLCCEEIIKIPNITREIMDLIFYISLTLEAEILTLAHLIHYYEKEELDKVKDQLVDIIMSKEMDEKHRNALVCLLVSKIPEAAALFNGKLTFSIINLLVSHSSELNYEALNDFMASNASESIDCFAFILQTRKEVAVQLLPRSYGKVLLYNIYNDPSPKNLSLVELMIDNVPENQAINRLMISICKEHDLSDQIIYIVRKLKNINKESFYQTWRAINHSDIKMILRKLENIIEHPKNTK